MTVRPAELEDLEACLKLDHSYLTDHVWQMEVQESKALVNVSFHAVRLPRPVHVKYPRDRHDLLSAWHHHDCFLVAVDESPEFERKPPLITGYLSLAAHDWHKTGWVSDLVVAPEHRRRGIATQLLHAAKEWASGNGLRRLLVEIQTKNHPALCFLERLGFGFCGYNDRYYANQDIVLFFSVDLH